MPIIPVNFHANNPMAAMYAQLAADVRELMANQEQAQASRAYAEDSNEELEPFPPHISNTLFPLGFQLFYVSSYD